MGINRKHSQRGFTLLEIMMVLVIVALLMSVAVPSFEGFIERSRITNEVNRLVNNLNYARSTAVSQAQVITLASNDDSDWSSGWQIYATNTVTVGGVAFVAADTLLKDINGSAARLTVNSNAAGTPFISFRPNGMLNENGNVIIAVCDDGDDQQGRSITINLVGRVTVANAASCTP